MAITYWQQSNGIVWAVDDNQHPDPAWIAVTLTDYNNYVAASQADIDAAMAAGKHAACADKLQAYNELKASVHTSDWPEHLFVFLTGSDGSACP